MTLIVVSSEELEKILSMLSWRYMLAPQVEILNRHWVQDSGDQGSEE